VNLVTEKDTEGRVFVSTYPTMMGLIDDTRDGQRRFGVGHFDLVIIDEAHRSVFQKYRAIFDYFDSLLVGLTATPKDEVDRNTYSLFDLENGVPTDAYGLEEAVKDGFLVPPKAVSVPLRFQREGINYDELSEEEKEQWDALEWDEEGGVPDRIEAEAVNKWLFNKDTVDKVLEHVMTHGLKVAGGDRLGKTIIFAKNIDYAEFLAPGLNFLHLLVNHQAVFGAQIFGVIGRDGQEELFELNRGGLFIDQPSGDCYAIDDRLRTRRASGDVEVDGDDFFHRTDDIISVIPNTPSTRAGTDGKNQLGRGHGLISPPESLGRAAIGRPLA
jgi:hypothetical protein